MPYCETHHEWHYFTSKCRIATEPFVPLSIKNITESIVDELSQKLYEKQPIPLSQAPIKPEWKNVTHSRNGVIQINNEKKWLCSCGHQGRTFDQVGEHIRKNKKNAR